MTDSVYFFLDCFRGAEAKNVRLQGLEHILQFTAVDGKVFLRSYRLAAVTVTTATLKFLKSGWRSGDCSHFPPLLLEL